MNPAAERSSGNLILSSENFYWAVLDTSQLAGLGQRGLSRNFHRQLGYLFENVLPVPIEEVQVAYVRLTDGRYLACGLDKQLLRSQCNGHVHLGPDRVPPHISDAVKSEQINLLTGEFEPKAIQRLKARWLLQMTTMIALVTVLAAVGLHRRAMTCQDAIAGLNEAREQVFEIAGVDSLGGGTFSGGGQPPELRLTAEMRRLRQTRQAPVAESQLTDVTPLLAALLSRWPSPEDVHLQTESLSITPTVITLRGVVPASAAAQAIASSINTVELQSDFRAWTMAPPQVTNVRDGVQVVLQMTATNREDRP
jgi:hypothetical protein